MKELKAKKLFLEGLIIGQGWYIFHSVIDFFTGQDDIIGLLANIAFGTIVILIFKAINKITIISKIDEIQEKFYQSLPEDEYVKVKLSFLEKYNEKYFRELYSSFSFYAQRRPNDMIVLLAVDTKTASLIHKTEVYRKTIEIEAVNYKEKANIKDEDVSF